MANKRIFYASHQVSIQNDEVGDRGLANEDMVRGVQSVGITTNFNLQQIFELGQLALYENIEDLPDVEITLTKVLDGDELIYHKATQGASSTDPTLIGRSNSKCFVNLGIFGDADQATLGESALSALSCSGMFVSSLGYNFPLDDNFTEDITLVGNDKIWFNPPNYGNTLATSFSTEAANVAVTRGINEDDGPLSGVNRRQHLLYNIVAAASGLDTNGAHRDPDTTILPPEVFGISNSGINVDDGSSFAAHISNITVSANLGREQINELGRRNPYHRFVSFPVEVTTEIEATAHSGDMVSAVEAGIYQAGAGCNTESNLQNRTIRIATCEGTRIYTGLKNKLSSVNYGGGDTGGGNATVTWTYTTFNDLTVIQINDPHTNGATWWTTRGIYLADAQA